MSPTLARLTPIAFLGALVMMTSPSASAEAPAVTEEEAHATGVEAYLYLYRLSPWT